MTTQFKKGVIELCILKVVEKEDLYAFEVINKLESLDVNENTIYPVLRRLTSQGYFKTYLKESNLGAPRRYYQITNAGKTQLRLSVKEWDNFTNSVKEILGGDLNVR